MFSYKKFEIYKNTCFEEQMQKTVSGKINNKNSTYS